MITDLIGLVMLAVLVASQLKKHKAHKDGQLQPA
jgi:hypothetical protein